MEGKGKPSNLRSNGYPKDQQQKFMKDCCTSMFALNTKAEEKYRFTDYRKAIFDKKKPFRTQLLQVWVFNELCHEMNEYYPTLINAVKDKLTRRTVQYDSIRESTHGNNGSNISRLITTSTTRDRREQMIRRNRRLWYIHGTSFRIVVVSFRIVV